MKLAFLVVLAFLYTIWVVATPHEHQLPVVSSSISKPCKHPCKLAKAVSFELPRRRLCRYHPQDQGGNNSIFPLPKVGGFDDDTGYVLMSANAALHILCTG